MTSLQTTRARRAIATLILLVAAWAVPGAAQEPVGLALPDQSPVMVEATRL